MKKTDPGLKPDLLIWAGGFAPVGGIETFIADLGQAAVRAGFDVELFGWDRRSQLLNNMREAGVRISCSPWRWGCHWGLPDWLTFPAGLWKSRNARVMFFGKTLREPIHNLIHRFRKKPRSSQRFVYLTPYRPAELWADITTPRQKARVADMLGTFDLIICQDAVFASDLRALGYRGPIEVLPYLPPAAADVPAPYPKGPLTLGFLGRLEHQKNLPALLNHFASLRREIAGLPEPGPSLRLRLIGEGTQRMALMALAQELDIADSVDFCGRLPRERVREAIRECHVFCFTSHTEGQPLAALEILAEGRPIVATAVGAFPAMLSNPALGAVVPTDAPAAFLSALKNVLASQDKGLILPHDVVRGYQEKFNREDVLRQYMKVFSPEMAAPDRMPVAEETDLSAIQK